MIRILHGDCAQVLKTLADNSVDSIVTDPPYGLSFMGKKWDYDVPSVEVWGECLRVLKPGGHLLCFAGTRTQHRMATRIEDGGFEIRDMLMFHYGSGFPKSLNVSKALLGQRCVCDEAVRGVRRDVGACHSLPSDTQPNVQRGMQEHSAITQQVGAGEVAADHSMRNVRSAGASSSEPRRQDQGDLLQLFMPGCDERDRVEEAQREHEGAESRAATRAVEPSVERWRDAQAAEGELHGCALRASAGVGEADGTQGRLHHGAQAGDGAAVRIPADAHGSGRPSRPQPSEQRAEQPAAVPDERGSQAWRGWPVCGGCGKPILPEGLGTALKPATEPITLARKPLQGTVAANVLKHGTGALWIDGCRVSAEVGDEPFKWSEPRGGIWKTDSQAQAQAQAQALGRWPANVLHDGSEEVLAAFPSSESPWIGNPNQGAKGGRMFGGGEQSIESKPEYRDTGSAARFFYTAKASRFDRNDGTYDLAPRFAPTMGNGIGGKEHDPATATRKGNHHPTVKPTDLMRYLCRLVTPPGGLVLDPFMGSGSTLKAAELEGFNAIGIELSAEYVEIAKRRIASDMPLFANVEAA